MTKEYCAAYPGCEKRGCRQFCKKPTVLDVYFISSNKNAFNKNYFSNSSNNNNIQMILITRHVFIYKFGGDFTLAKCY